MIVTGSRVGIGTSRPTDKLTVSGSVNSVTQILTASLYRSESANLITIGTSSGLDIYETGFVKIRAGVPSSPLIVNVFKIHPSASYLSTVNVVTFNSASSIVRFGFHYGKAVFINGTPGSVDPSSTDSADLTYFTGQANGSSEAASILTTMYGGLKAEVNSSNYRITYGGAMPTNLQNYTCSIHTKYEIFKT